VRRGREIFAGRLDRERRALSPINSRKGRGPLRAYPVRRRAGTGRPCRTHGARKLDERGPAGACRGPPIYLLQLAAKVERK